MVEAQYLSVHEVRVGDAVVFGVRPVAVEKIVVGRREIAFMYVRRLSNGDPVPVWCQYLLDWEVLVVGRNDTAVSP